MVWLGTGIFNQPWGVALGADGKIFVTDYGTSSVDVFTPQYQLFNQWNVTQNSNLLAAESVAVDGNGVAYVTDSYGTLGLFDAYGDWLGSIQGVTRLGSEGIFFDSFNETRGCGGESKRDLMGCSGLDERAGIPIWILFSNGEPYRHL